MVLIEIINNSLGRYSEFFVRTPETCAHLVTTEQRMMLMYTASCFHTVNRFQRFHHKTYTAE